MKKATQEVQSLDIMMAEPSTMASKGEMSEMMPPPVPNKQAAPKKVNQISKPTFWLFKVIFRLKIN